MTLMLTGLNGRIFGILMTEN